MPIRFHDFELDEARFELTRAGRPVPLRPKAFDLLAHLVRHRERVVRREELIGVVWGKTRVGMGSLSGLVNEVRQALGEAAGADSSIRTVHARGYRFVAPVLPDALEAGRVHDAPDDGFAAELRTAGAASGLRAPVADGGHEAPEDPLVRVAERGAWGILVEDSPGPGVGPRTGCVAERARPASVEALVERAEGMGFELWEIIAPHEAMVTAGRLASDLLERALSERARAAVLEALPLPARVCVGERSGEPVAGGQGAVPGGPIGGLPAITSMLARLARRRPILLVVHSLVDAGARYAAEVGRLVRELGSAPVLVVVPGEGLADSAGAARVRRQLLERAGFDRWRRWPAAEAERGPLSEWLEARDLPPLPGAVERALLEHFRVEPARGADAAPGGEPFRGAESAPRGEPARAAESAPGGEPARGFEGAAPIEGGGRASPERVRVRRVEPRPKGDEARRKA